MHRSARVAALAERQHRVVTAWQLALLGVPESTVRERVKNHGWRRWSRGVFMLPGEITPLRRLAAALLAYSRPHGSLQRLIDYQWDHQDKSLVDALAHVALDAGAVACAASAAWLHGLEKPPNQAWVRVRTHGGQAPRKNVRLCHGTYTGRVCWIQGLPVVDVEQVFIDIAGITGDSAKFRHHRLTKLIATADALRKTHLDAIAQRLEAVTNVRGRTALAAAVSDLRGELSHSDTEAAAKEIVRRVAAGFGLEPESRPHQITLRGRVVAEADIAILDILYDVEIDGPHHLLLSQRAKDDARDKLARRARWTVERYSTELVDLSPKVFEARVADTIAHLLNGTP